VIQVEAERNEAIARDFSAQVQTRPVFRHELNEKLVIEVGCGTGDLTSILTDIHYCAMEGTDSSALAIEIARIRFPHLIFKHHNILKDKPLGYYDVAISNNLIQYFNPRRLINKMFKMATTVIIIEPASLFSFGMLAPYRVISGFMFCGGDQEQIAIALRQE
jgi:trans-aconitate methyltransferase